MQPRYPKLHSTSDLTTSAAQMSSWRDFSLHSPDSACMSHHFNIWQKKVIYYSCLPWHIWNGLMIKQGDQSKSFQVHFYIFLDISLFPEGAWQSGKGMAWRNHAWPSIQQLPPPAVPKCHTSPAATQRCCRHWLASSHLLHGGSSSFPKI